MKALSRKIILLISDIILVNLSIYLALYFRFDGRIPVDYMNLLYSTVLSLTVIKIMVYYIFRLYSSLWRYASIDELIQVFFATSTDAVLSFVFGLLSGLRLPRTVYIMSWILTFLFIGGFRFSYRIGRKLKAVSFSAYNNHKRVLIVGAGEAGSMVIKELKSHEELKSIPVAVIDDDFKKHRASINGVPIVGDRSRIKESVQQYEIDEIIIAMPSVSKGELRDILRLCKGTKCKLKTLPGVYELINENVTIKSIRDVSIEDLLGRDEVKLSMSEISGYLKDEVVLVSGGGGSIGSELCRQIAKFHPKTILILDIYENNAYELQNELNHLYKGKLNLQVLIGSVRDRIRLEEIFEAYKPGVVFHAAAHKHVPLMEDSPKEAVKNNVFGTLNMAEASKKHGVKKFILISTDKAVNPTNIMGATKRLAEMIIQAMNQQSQTEFAAVRFGNVLGSNGSVIPLFRKQIANGGPVTVTHPEVTRFFMTIPEAAQLVIQAGAMAKGGEVFILDMGESVKIIDLARDLIKLSGFEPDTDIEIIYTGLRPGEKLYEELMLKDEDLSRTLHECIFVTKSANIDHSEAMSYVKQLEHSLGDTAKLKKCIKDIVPNYNPPESINSNNIDILNNSQITLTS